MSRTGAKLKILIYGEYFLPVVGGVQTSMNLLARGLAALSAEEKESGARGVEVTVATRTAANGMDDASLPYSVVRQPGFWRLVRLIRESDVVHVAGPCLVPIAIAWLLHKPAVVEHHGYQAICPNGLLFQRPAQTVCPGYFMKRQYGECLRCCSSERGLGGRLRDLLLTFPRHWLCKKVDVNITISDHVAMRVRLPRSRTVYYGIDDPGSADDKHHVASRQTPQIGYVGRLFAEKGPTLLLHAAENLKNRGTALEVSFIGDGPERERLESLVDELGLRDFVTLTGDLRGEALDRAVSGIDVVVMPSVCEETAGLSAIEQMMRGRVVVAADIGGLSEVVGDAGLKFIPGDAQALAACLQHVIDEPARAKSLGAAARGRALQLFTRDHMIRQHLSIYRELCSH